MKKSLLLPALAIFATAGSALAAVSFDGNTLGIWSNPVGGENNVINNGDPVSTFAWGKPRLNTDDTQSVLTFTGIDPFGPVGLGEFFDLGCVDYYNGTVKAGSSATAVDLELDVNFTSPAGSLITFSYTLTLNSVSDTPVPSADFVSLPDVPEKAFQLGGFDYKLFVSFDGNQNFEVEEGATDSVKLKGFITGRGVPESGSSLALLGGGMLLVGGLRRKFKAQR
jgi:hypothetical protein